jgi:magnesium-transporting ATPase (P-type)
MYFTGENRVNKEESKFFGYTNKNGVDNHKDNPDPFLFADSKVMSGQGKAIVCAVGDNTMLARYRK